MTTQYDVSFTDTTSTIGISLISQKLACSRIPVPYPIHLGSERESEKLAQQHSWPSHLIKVHRCVRYDYLDRSR